MKPTNEQIKEFWEWVFDKEEVEFHEALGGALCIYQRGKWIKEDEEFTLHFLGYGAETIDLNNLFKYAVPKLDGAWAMRLIHYVDSDSYHIELTYGTLKYGDIKTEDKDPALALFWAIKKVINET